MSDLRVFMFSHSEKGGREYVEDCTITLYDHKRIGREIGQCYSAVFDGHGGQEAATNAKENLWATMKRQRGFYSTDADCVVRAIKDGFLATHHAMWSEQDHWPKTKHGMKSTSGTTAAVVIIRGRKMYVAHVGDSGVVLATKDPGTTDALHAKTLTSPHKPDSVKERERIEALGGKVVERNGVHRVVWERPLDPNHRGPLTKSIKTELVPFLAMARALGDFWSYNHSRGEFLVSPIPDVKVFDINTSDKFLIIASDGLWDVVRPDEAVHCVQDFIERNEQRKIDAPQRVVDLAMARWKGKLTKADNTSVVIVFIEDRKTYQQ